MILATPEITCTGVMTVTPGSEQKKISCHKPDRHRNRRYLFPDFNIHRSRPEPAVTLFAGFGGFVEVVGPLSTANHVPVPVSKDYFEDQEKRSLDASVFLPRSSRAGFSRMPRVI